MIHFSKPRISDFQTNKFRLVILSIFLLIPLNLIHCQEIKTDSIRICALDQNNDSNLVYDVNDELCSMVILKTDMDSIRLYSNRGIEKIIRTGDEYRAWLPNGATLFKILSPGFPLYDVALPESYYEYSVYIIVLDVNAAQEVIYTDTASHILSFTSEPTKADVFINDKPVGKTPLSIENPDYKTFAYVVKKTKRYSKVEGYDSLTNKLSNINIVLRDRSRDKRLFIIPQVFTEDFGYESSGYQTQGDIGEKSTYGVGFGRIGKTGWYINAKYCNYTYKRIMLTGGVTQQIAMPVFITLGAGISSKESSRDNFTGFNIHAGLIFRVAWFGMIYFDFNHSMDDALKGTVYNFGMGLGINFYDPIKVFQTGK